MAVKKAEKATIKANEVMHLANINKDLFMKQSRPISEQTLHNPLPSEHESLNAEQK